MAKAVVPSLDAVPEPLRGEYERQADGTYAIKLEGVPPGFALAKDLAEANGKIVELRNTNIQLLKGIGAETIDAALTRVAAFSGIDTSKLERLKVIDPDRYATLEANALKLKDKGVDDPDALDAKLKLMLDAALAPVKTELATEKAARADAQARADKALVREVVGKKFLANGGKASALDFIVEKAPYRVVENEVKAQDGKFSSAKPGEPLPVDEWLAGVTKEYDFAFEPSKGGGANGGNGNGAGTGVPHTGPFRTSSGAELKTDGITTLS
jgi:hypothetical protein